jgi:hypothetical protein
MLHKLTALAGVVLAVAASGQVSRTPPPEKTFTPGEPVEQPLPYSHKTHVALGLKCLDCHAIADPGDFAGFPAEAKCMACHTAIKSESPHIQKLTAAEKSGEPIAWKRVYKLPEFVYFSHAVHHLDAKVGCQTCHGEVAQRDVMSQEKPITMHACMRCHTETGASNECGLCHDTH